MSISDKTGPTAMQIEKALAGHVDAVGAAALLGVTKQAIYKRPDWVKREMGGVWTPAGWVFDPERIKGYQPPTGRPTEARRTAGPFPVGL